MAQSIESIWKHGFIREDDLVAPIINDLYAQKSVNIIDKLQRMFDLNIKYLKISALVIFPLFYWMEMEFFGASLALLLLTLILPGNRFRKELNSFEKTTSCYDYLKGFQEWRDRMVADFTRIYRFFYPALFISGMIQIRLSELGGAILSRYIENHPESLLFVGIPLGLLGIILVVAALLVWGAEAIYKLDLNLVFGRDFKRLDEIISDMEAMRDTSKTGTSA